MTFFFSTATTTLFNTFHRFHLIPHTSQANTAQHGNTHPPPICPKCTGFQFNPYTLPQPASLTRRNPTKQPRASSREAPRRRESTRARPPQYLTDRPGAVKTYRASGPDYTASRARSRTGGHGRRGGGPRGAASVTDRQDSAGELEEVTLTLTSLRAGARKIDAGRIEGWRLAAIGRGRVTR